jgi:glutathione S-transferase
MKLFYAAGACSLSPHIVLRELGIPFDLEKVDLQAKKTESGRDFLSVNPKGYVPALEFAPGEVLTEGVAIHLYLASLKPGTTLLPQAGTTEYFRALEWLVFVSSEMHKGLGSLFGGPNPAVVEKLRKRFAFLEKHFATQDYLGGKDFSLADSYLFTVLSWADHLKVDLSPFPALLRFVARVAARPKVQEALAAEGLLTPA